MLQSVVLIDDDSDDLDFILEAMQDFNASLNCTSFMYPQEAILSLASDNVSVPAFIFIDINMPRINGFECVDELKKIERLKDSEIVMISTMMTPEIRRQLEEKGIRYCFQKPNTIRAYSEILESIFSVS